MEVGDYDFKFIIVGEGGVGKTSITSQFVENRFIENHIVTIGVDFT